ncbi:hypothetical protein J1792_32220 [Streptomyces triculaminicus]|uniref:Recombination endonuclease VII n=1 Tax=Streptomyces triculaminicus TaxID=2816232 RepID=A0A939FUU2_9ACTN|nr:endonuclease domain-containing protein [Streptomyces triculaminicus]MBO0657214.1 hypothetical protein [Streptomyces triculaminicus]
MSRKSSAQRSELRWVCQNVISERWPGRLCSFPGIGGPDKPGPVNCVRHRTDEERARHGSATPGPGDNYNLLDEGWMLPEEPACWSWEVPPDPVETLVAGYRAEFRMGEALARMLGAGGDPEFRGEMALNFWQDGCCAVCSRRDTLVTDHCHTSGLVRGLLCKSCNVKEGHHFSGGAVFRHYRQRPATVLLGVRLRYYNSVTGFAEPLPPRYRRSVTPWWEQLPPPPEESGTEEAETCRTAPQVRRGPSRPRPGPR